MAATFGQQLDGIHRILIKDLSLINNPDFKAHCNRCEDPIFGNQNFSHTNEGIKYIFHTKCFTCQDCAKGIENQAFYLYEDAHLCQDCYYKAVLGICHSCKIAFNDPVVVSAGGKKFHAKCFACVKCKSQLVSSYIEASDGFTCKECYENEHLPCCAACNKRVNPDKASGTLICVEWESKKYHKECFVCKSCSGPFKNLKALVLQDQLYCNPCFERKSSELKVVNAK